MAENHSQTPETADRGAQPGHHAVKETLTSEHTPTDDPLLLSQVLTEEYNAIHNGTLAQNGTGDEVTRLKSLYKTIHDGPGQTALCFSGGGIRSATFNLGVIQALAQFKLLGKFDYLSTVSGGGYIGAWLTAWIHRSRKAGGSGITDVQNVLNGANRNTCSSASRTEPRAITWLREFSNYLTPTLGLFSADTWTMFGTVLRNLLLNWLVLIPLITASLMMPRLQIAVIRHAPDIPTQHLLLWAGLLLALVSLTYLHFYRPDITHFRDQSEREQDPNTSVDSSTDFGRQGWFIRLSLIPLILSSYCLTTTWAWHRNMPGRLSDLTFSGWTTEWTFAATGAAIHLTSWIIAILWTLLVAIMNCKNKKNGTNCPKTSPSSDWKGLLRGGKVVEGGLIALSGMIGGYALWAILAQTPSESLTPQIGPPYPPTESLVADYAEWYAAFSVSGFLGLFLLVATLFIGLSGRFTHDQEHEFWGRTGAWGLNAGIAIGAVGAIIIFGPGWIAKMGAWTMASVGGVAGLLSLAGGFSARTLFAPSDTRNRTSRFMEYGVKLATPLFVILLIIGLALGSSALIKTWSVFRKTETAHWTETGLLMPGPDDSLWIHSQVLHHANVQDLLSLCALLIAIGLTMGLCINVNKFSLHGFYRNRLIRAYLGASRSSERRPNPLTGFDPADNIYMAELANYDFDTANRSSTAIQRPFHIVNIALNLVHSKQLAWQQRKAQSFTVSPLHCGSWQGLGYRRSEKYGYSQAHNRAISLGTAIATSGAAASPNMGYHSSATVTFLLALFNIRLGWWLGNPGPAGNTPFFGKLGKALHWWPTYKRAYPAFTIGPLIKELFGLTDATQSYVYLSDGGHFENLALYEMVLRRCRHIIVIDAGCDPEMSFQDLGNAIRKIRIDQGIDIEIDTDMIKPQSGSQFSRWHHAIGSIRYDKADQGAPVGTLIYLKPSLTGKEPSDVQDYAAHHTTFPHEPTSDQFFDESQFESYRRLGEHIAYEVFNPITTDTLSQSVSDLFHKLRSHWVTLPPGIKESFLKETEGLCDIERQLREDPYLLHYDTQLYPELNTIMGFSESVTSSDSAAPADTGQMERSVLHLCHTQIQLMENVFLAVQLDKYHAHPLNRGWINLFRRWAAAEDFRRLWPVLRGGFSKAFVDFAGYQLNLGDSQQEVIWMVTRGKNGALQTPTCASKRIVPAGPIDLDPVIREFRQEWPEEPMRHGFLTALETAGKPPDPPILVATPPHGAKTHRQPLGVAFAVNTTQKGSECIEWRVFVWIRGAHRRLGIGGHLLDQLIHILPHPSTTKKDRKLIVILPELPRNHPGYVLEKAGWLQFFDRCGFHLVRDTGLYRLERCDRSDSP